MLPQFHKCVHCSIPRQVAQKLGLLRIAVHVTISMAGKFSVRQIGQLPKVKLNSTSSGFASSPLPPRIVFLHFLIRTWIPMTVSLLRLTSIIYVFEQRSKSKCQSFCLILCLCLYPDVSLAVFFNKPLSQCLIGLPKLAVCFAWSAFCLSSSDWLII